MSHDLADSAAIIYKQKFEEANQLLSSKLYADAENIYSSLIIESCGGDAALLCKLGDLHYKISNFDLAIKILDSAISIDPKFPWGYICKAEVFEEIGRLAEAKDCLIFVEKNFTGYDFVKERIKILNDLIRDETEITPEIFTLSKNSLGKHKKPSSPKIAVIAWDIAHNPVGRAWALCEITSSFSEVCLLGPANESFGKDLWQPLCNAPRSFDITSFCPRDFAGLMNGSIELVLRNKFDVVIVSKARFPSMLIGILYKLIHGSKLILDIDDDELSFVDAKKELDIDEFINSYESSFWEKSYGKGWTQFANSLISYFDGLTTCNAAFHQKLGGVIIRHARDGGLMVAHKNSSTKKLRIDFGFSDDDWIVLFLGTARQYKGLKTLAEAIKLTGNPKIVLVIAGHLDNDLKISLEEFMEIRIIFYPHWPFQDMALLYGIANCICLIQDPYSISANWQTPAKISDALMFGVPIIATSTLGISELIERGIILETKPDAYSVSQSIKSLYKSTEEQISNIKTNFSKIFKNEFSIDANALVLEQYLNEIKSTNSAELEIVFSKLFIFIDQRMPGLLSDSWREKFANYISARPIAKEMTSPNSGLNIVFFWKQNDSGIYDRRHDMLIKELSENPAVNKILQIDAPICIDEVMEGLSINPFENFENSIISKKIIERYLTALDCEKIIRRTFVYRARGGGDETHLLGQELPLRWEYPNYVEQWIKKAGMTDNLMAWVCPVVPEFESIQKRIGFSFILADLIDDQRHYVQKVSTLRKINKSYENIFKLANVAITNCQYNFQLISEKGARPYLIPNALPINLNKTQYIKPDSLKNMVGPVIGYAGNMRDRFDWTLIGSLASLRPDWNLVLIGELPNLSKYKDLIHYPNIHFLGAMPSSRAIQYISFFDVGIIPHINDKLSKSMNPLKLYVYRGLGLDVVSTDIPNLDIIDAGVTVTTPDLFVDAIDKALARKLKEGRLYMSNKDIATHSWGGRLSKIFELINQNFKEIHDSTPT
jgi:glycosyltransferase involved in cell wall biosynthesis